GQGPADSLASGPKSGRQLAQGDAGTRNVLLPQSVTEAPLNLVVGDSVTVADQSLKLFVTLHVVGFYTPTLTTFAPIYADASVVTNLTRGKPLYVYSLNLNPKTADGVMARLHGQVPGVQTFTVGDFARFITSLLNNLIVMLEAIASLAMIAGVIIIANAVALAMLERRRELGILKAVGHTSQSVLSGVLLENGVVGFTGAFLAMVLVTLATTVLSKALFKTAFGVGVPIVLVTVLGTALICMLVAALVAWNATRVRPLEVLRYE
ncbi:MAG TPA: ABC transporter permease, partial [Ktedonobacterales bacterium]